MSEKSYNVAFLSKAEKLEPFTFFLKIFQNLRISFLQNSFKNKKFSLENDNFDTIFSKSMRKYPAVRADKSGGQTDKLDQTAIIFIAHKLVYIFVGFSRTAIGAF